MKRFQRETLAQRHDGQRPVRISASSGPITNGAIEYAASTAARPKSPGDTGGGNWFGTSDTKGGGVECTIGACSSVRLRTNCDTRRIARATAASSGGGGGGPGSRTSISRAAWRVGSAAAGRTSS